MTPLQCSLIAALAGIWPLQAQPRNERSCVDVKIGQEQYYSCLNQQLATLVPNHRTTAADAPLGINSPITALGGFDQAAVHERLGNAFGHSIVPQRPNPGFAPGALGMPGQPGSRPAAR